MPVYQNLTFMLQWLLGYLNKVSVHSVSICGTDCVGPLLPQPPSESCSDPRNNIKITGNFLLVTTVVIFDDYGYECKLLLFLALPASRNIPR